MAACPLHVRVLSPMFSLIPRTIVAGVKYDERGGQPLFAFREVQSLIPYLVQRQYPGETRILALH